MPSVNWEAWAAAVLVGTNAGAMQPRTEMPAGERSAGAARAPVAVTKELRREALGKGVEAILRLQQGDEKAEWPYEGVYRVRGNIPDGYRVGGTAICVMALVEAPGYAEDEARKSAVARGVAFICKG